MKATIIEDVCTGCGLCEQTCPEVFEIKADKAVVIADPVPQEVEGKAAQAASECPVEAIKIE